MKFAVHFIKTKSADIEYQCATCPNEVNGKDHETLALARNHSIN